MDSTAKLRDAIEFARRKCKISFQLRDKQIECIENIVKKQDTIAILPTSYGKSLIYTLLPHVLDKYYEQPCGHNICVLISPLIALMEEQQQKITSYGVTCIYLSSSQLSAGEYTNFCI